MSGPQPSRKHPLSIHIRAGHARPLLRDDIKKGAVAHPLKNKDRSKSQKRLYNFGLLL